MLARLAKYSSRYLLVAAIAVALSTGFSVHSLAHAQASTPQRFVVLAGASGPGNTDLLEFFPKDIQVHQGDTVTWMVNGFHNISFVGSTMDTSEPPEQLFVTSEINGQQTTYINPDISTPTLHDGDSYTGGKAESGLPVMSPALSLVIDAPPGTYYYHCDVHYGAPDAEQHMEGSVTVVDDATTIPSPTDVIMQGIQQIGDSVNQGMGAMATALQQSMPESGSGSMAMTVTVQTGTQGGLATVNQFFPMVTVIHPGDSVTWTNNSPNEIHTVTWPPIPEDQQMTPGTDANGNPIMEVNPTAFGPSMQSGGDWVADGQNNSGALAEGQSFTARFPDPGVYPYVCILHPAMNGVVVVMPAGQ